MNDLTRENRADPSFRVEHDLLGEREVPAHAYYGIHTLRALENFPITGIPLSSHPELISAIAMVKSAAAQANRTVGLLDRDRERHIVGAAQRISDGEFHEEFPVDVVQGGAGTSTNMNANEVIANIALVSMGLRKGEYDRVHPNNHVNLSQSTNDVYPTAVRIAVLLNYRALTEALRSLCEAFRVRSVEFDRVIKVGRTQLQDAVPITLGQEFAAFATTVCEDVDRLEEVVVLFREISLGGTAIGTGINTHPDYARTAVRNLSRIAGVDLIQSPNLIEATADCGAFVTFSGLLKRIAVKISKICNDLRLMSSGPRAGFGEINLPPVQAGSSIMPGKVNPVIPEMVNQVAYEVIGSDLTVTMAAESGQLQLNAFGPLIAHRVLSSMKMMTGAMNVLRERCIDGITPNRERCRQLLDASLVVVTPLNARLGYEGATRVAQRALREGCSVREIVLSEGLIAEDELDRLLDPMDMLGPG